MLSLLPLKWIYGIGAAIAALAATWFAARKSAKSDAKAEAAQTKSKQEGKGRDAVAEEQRAIDGLGNRDLVDRVRRRDGDWRGV